MIRGGRAGYDRLQVLARKFWPATSEFLERAGVSPGMRCLDLGCGGGDVSLRLAQLVGPNGHVLGIDMDEVKLDLARREAEEQDISNVEFRTGNVTEWHAECTYDLVYSRFLLQHLRRPVELLGRMWDAVAAGGVIAVEDADFDGMFSEPANEGFEFLKRIYPQVLARYGGDSTGGRKLHGYFLTVGIPDPELRLLQRVDTSGEAKTLCLLTLEATADAIVSEDLATRAEVEAALESLAAFTNDPATLIGDPRTFQVSARR